ncbi:DUF6233 domain-containing protein [Streptomyces sp. NPDC019890]|uniref:DUF6233 domain-containing protein n=1 Tax=Streptomyces sp. NPDC019890 TaxID=3365064 RepID=UPI003851088A
MLPDAQTVEVRLYERLQTTGQFPWRFRIGIPAWVATEGGVEPAEYSVWVTDQQLRPIDGVDLSTVPTHRRVEPPLLPKPSGWVVRPDPQRRGGTLVHDATCRQAAGGGREMGSLEALDALMHPGAKACYDCAAAEILLPAMELGQGYG